MTRIHANDSKRCWRRGSGGVDGEVGCLGLAAHGLKFLIRIRDKDQDFEFRTQSSGDAFAIFAAAASFFA